MIPLVFEAPTGAAGKAMLQLIKSVHNHHRAYVLPFDDRHETSIFKKTGHTEFPPVYNWARQT